MKDKDLNSIKIQQLLEYIAQLEQDNNVLSNRAEEILLLSLLSDTITSIDDEESLIDELLEKISVLKSLPFCSCYAKSIDGYRLITDYFVGDYKKEKISTLTLNRTIENELNEYHIFNHKVQECNCNYVYDFPINISPETEILIIPFESQWIKEGIFIFFSNNKEHEIKENILIIQQAIRLVLDKIDNLNYIKKIEYFNQNLESTVEQRTKELSEINEKLIIEINERHNIEVKLREARDKAQESDRLKSAFLANMSHEIRTPMNAIVGFSEILADGNCSTEEIINYTNLIYSNSLSLLNLINDLLDFSKIEANQLLIFKQSCNLGKVLSEIKILSSGLLKQSNKEHIKLVISNEKESNNIYINTDELRLKQILLNLTSNAIKFSFEGEIQISYYDRGDNFLFEVSDTGIGIEETQHDIIFNRFTRVVNNENKSILGTGLGLTITKNLVDMLGGEISVVSKPGKGSVFMFTIDVS